MIRLNLFGDSHFVRMHKFLRRANYSNIQVDTVIAESGIRISKLKALIKQRKPKIQAGTINLIFIATNDLKQGRSFQQIKTDLLSLIALFRRILPEDAQLILVSLPNFPAFQNQPHTLGKIYHLNRLIVSVNTERIHHLQWQLVKPVEFYIEAFYNGSHPRKDGIHLNFRGFEYIINSVCRWHCETR